MILLGQGIDWLDLLNQVLLIALRARSPVVAKNVSLKREGKITKRFLHSGIKQLLVPDSQCVLFSRVVHFSLKPISFIRDGSRMLIPQGVWQPCAQFWETTSISNPWVKLTYSPWYETLKKCSAIPDTNAKWSLFPPLQCIGG